MKHCDICKKQLLVESFGNNRRNKDGLHTTCKTCKKRLDKEYQEKNKERIKARRHEYYLDNKEEIIKKVYAYYPSHRVERRRHSITARKKLKTEIFNKYGGVKCCNCPETELDLLTIDHIDGGGNKHRESIGLKRAGHPFYHWLKRNGYPEGYQVLCWNCQYRKRQKEMSPVNPTKRQLQKAAYIQLVKTQCLERYGKVCPCGETDPVVLTLDHVNDDGAQHRRETNTKGISFYLHLRKNGFPNDPPLQVLCMKCQYRKKNEEGKDRPTSDTESAADVVSEVRGEVC